ncbi:MAG: virulence protein RhuM/Fic/DOC family protein [Bacteroidota bacterium]
MSEIRIYKNHQNQIELAVQFEGDTVWLSQEQMAILFETSKQNISLHIQNCFKEGELNKLATVKDSLTVRQEGNRSVKRKIEFYNLDVIISVGYRIKSQQGTQFRLWATSNLKELLLRGYVVNAQRLAQKEQEIKVLKSGIQIMSRAIEQKSKEVGMEWLDTFAKGLELLDDYDHESLDQKGISKRRTVYPDIKEYYEVVEAMRKEFDSAVFGKEKDDSFSGSVTQIAKGMGEQDFYPTIEEKAAMLLYLITKNHSFVDGNKRIAAACFLLFLERNELLFIHPEAPIISNEALAALTLYVANSKPDEMETTKRLIISVLNRNQL